MFKKNFDSIVVPGDTITCEVAGFRCEATAHFDEDTTPYNKYMEPIDPDLLRTWLADEWQYFTIAVTVWREGVCLTGQYDHTICGIETNYPEAREGVNSNDYLLDVANELLPGALESAKATIAALARYEP